VPSWKPITHATWTLLPLRSTAHLCTHCGRTQTVCHHHKSAQASLRAQYPTFHTANPLTLASAHKSSNCTALASSLSSV